VEAAFVGQTFHCEFPALDIALHLELQLAHLLDTAEGCDKLRRVIRPDHAAAGRKTQWFENAGIRRPRGQRLRIFVASGAKKPGHPQAGGLIKLAREKFVIAGTGGRGQMERNAEHLRRRGRQNRGTVPHCGNTIETQPAKHIDGFGNAVELHRNSAVAPGIFEHVAAIRGQRELDPQPARGIGEDPDLVAGSGGKQ
jgi:hypothetical protein